LTNNFCQIKKKKDPIEYNLPCRLPILHRRPNNRTEYKCVIANMLYIMKCQRDMTVKRKKN